MPTRLVLILLVVLAAAFRGIFLVADPDNTLLSGLTIPQGEVARNIVDNGEWFRLDPDAVYAIDRRQDELRGLVDPADFDYPPATEADPDLITPLGPALLLAGIWKATGSQRYIWLQLLQLVVGAALTLLVVWISWKLFGRTPAAIIAGALWALSPGLAFYGTLPLYEVWAACAAVGITGLYILARDRGGTWWMLALVGLAIAVATLFRQGLILLLLAFVAFELRDSWRSALRTLAILVAACAIGLIPWTVRSLIEFDQPRPFNGVGGQVLWQGLGDDTETFGAINDDNVTYEMVHAERPELGYGTTAYDDYLRNKAVDAIADHPFAWIKVVGDRLADSTIQNLSPVPTPPAIESSATGPVGFVVSWTNSLYPRVLRYYDCALFVVALGSAIFLWGRRERESVLLLGAVYLAALAVPVLIAGWQWRYAAPGLFALMILAGVGVDELIRLFAARWRASGLPGSGHLRPR